MKTLRPNALVQLCPILLLLSLLSFGPGTKAAALADFGYRHLTVNGHEALGQRRLVVLVVQFEDASIAHPVSWYDEYFFSATPTITGGSVSVNGAFLAMSNGRFSWSRGGAVGMTLPASQHYANFPDELLFHSNLVWQALSRRLINLAGYDDNADGIVTTEELQIAVVKNEGVSNGAFRNAGTVPDPHSTRAWQGGMPLFEHRTDFATVVHEMSHALATWDLYGCCCLSQNLTLMSCTLCLSETCAERPDIYHLDPWHKLQLGWSEPRIRTMRSGSVQSLPAAQMRDDTAPIILWDPAMGAKEFFMLEYRTRTSPGGPGYDANAAGDGLVIWHIQHDANLNPTIVENSRAVWSEGAPNLARGGSTVWGGGTTTPYLRWLNGCRTPVRIHVRPFAAGVPNITIEIESVPETWVDFAFLGSPELGTVDQPYNTLSEGVANIAWAGLMQIKAGVTPERLTINKAMTIDACGGPATLGRNP